MNDLVLHVFRLLRAIWSNIGDTHIIWSDMCRVWPSLGVMGDQTLGEGSYKNSKVWSHLSERGQEG
jgi:hypothetical protein